MSIRIFNSTVVLCLIFTVVLFAGKLNASNASQREPIKLLKHHGLMSEYQGYPSARRPELATLVLNRTSHFVD